MARESSNADPAVVLDLLESFRRSKTMFAAVSLGVFDALEAGPKTLSVLAELLELNADALERLLDACVGLQLLERSGGLYENTEAARAYLCKESPSRLTGYINYSNAILWKMWGNLEDAVRDGTNRWQQTFGWDGPIFSNFFRTEESMREFLMAMHGYGIISSPHVVAAFDLSRFRHLIDLGGATGHLAIAACERYPGLRAAVFRPSGSSTAGPGDCLWLNRLLIGSRSSRETSSSIGFPTAIFSPWAEFSTTGPRPKVLNLLERIFERLPSGGGLLIAEKLISEDRAGPRWAHMQNLGMLLYTEGKERTLSEYRRLLEQVGFSSVAGATTPSPLDAILALKP